MAYNLDLEDRIDKLQSQLGPIEEKKMFGGVGYFHNGNMCFGIHKESLVLRTSKENAEELLKNENISIFDITGRSMKGWLLISPDILETDEELLNILKEGLDFAASLPKK